MAVPGAGAAPRVIITADDFGLDPALNAAVEQAARHGVLSAASLRVGAPAADEAVTVAAGCPGWISGGILCWLTACRC